MCVDAASLGHNVVELGAQDIELVCAEYAVGRQIGKEALDVRAGYVEVFGDSEDVGECVWFHHVDGGMVV